MDIKVKEDRSIGLFILFTVLSASSWAMLLVSLIFSILLIPFAIICTLYNIIYTLFIIFFYRSWIDDVNVICDGDGQYTPEVLKWYLLNLVTFGIYGYFWIYNLQNRLRSNAPRYNVVISDTGTTVLLWDLIGALLLGVGPLIALHIMFESTNKLAYAYNQNNGEKAFSAPPVTPQISPPIAPQITPSPAQSAASQIVPQAAPSTAPPVAPSVMQPYPVMGQVKCIRGAATGQGFRIPANGKVIIGKNPSKATLVINESYVSNVHCTVQYNAGNNTYLVTDHSTNGTFANGVRLQKEVPMTYPAGTVLVLVNGNIEVKLG